MGLLGSLFNKGKKDNPPPPRAEDMVLPVSPSDSTEFTIPKPKSKRRLCLHGDEACKIYVYHGGPLKDVAVGQEIELTIDTKPQVIHSDLKNAQSWDTADSGYAVLYEGQVIGATVKNERLVKELANAGYQLVIRGKKTGWYEKNIIPEIEIYLPQFQEIRTWCNVQGSYAEEIPFEWEKDRINCKDNVVDRDLSAPCVPVTFRLRGPNPGSKAKPRLEVYAGDMLICDTAGRGDWPQIAEGKYYAVASRVESLYDDGYYYRIDCCHPPLS